MRRAFYLCQPERVKPPPESAVRSGLPRKSGPRPGTIRFGRSSGTARPATVAAAPDGIVRPSFASFHRIYLHLFSFCRQIASDTIGALMQHPASFRHR